MINEAKEKKMIVEDWQNAFPQLNALAQNKIYKVLGPSIIGIELIKLPRVEDYKPYFVVYPLWKANIKECFNQPVILREIFNRKGLQFSIPFKRHKDYFIEAVDCVRKQIQIPLDKNVSISELFNLIDSSFNDILVKTNSAQQAKLFELKVYASLYINDIGLVKNTLNQIQNRCKVWNIELFEMWYGNFDKWFESLNNIINSRNEFMDQIQANKDDKKIQKLVRSELLA